uniref:NYN domain-containing protein n=1 Tax=Tetranychus urticae TaxID=32264 RepID=T1KGI5_TETUR
MMAKPCAVFWDIENIGVPKGQSVASIINQIRSTIIKPYNLNEIFFFCICDVHRLPANVGHSLIALDVDIVQAYNGVKNSADIVIMDLMRKFVKFSGQDCTIILLSGDADYYGTLSDLKKLHNVSIHLIRRVNSWSPKLDEISDYTFILNDGVLKLIKSTGAPKYFISVNSYSLIANSNQVMNELNDIAHGSIENSAILYGNLICIGFPSLSLAEKAIEQLNGCQYHEKFLKAELINDSPLTDILKSIKIEKSSDNNYSVKPCDQVVNALNNIPKIDEKAQETIVRNTEVETPLKALKIKALDAYSVSQVNQIFNIKSEKNNIKNTIIDAAKSSESRSVIKHELPVSSSVSQVKSNFKMFFHCESPVNTNLSTKWSLLYNLFEKSYDLGAKKVIFDRNIFCLHFDSKKSYQQMLDKKDSLDLRGLRILNVDSLEQQITKKMIFYPSSNPWCLSQELDLHCILIKLADEFHSNFIDESKGFLGNRECIFIKSLSEEIWIGFPDAVICEDSCRHVLRLLQYPYKSVEKAKPSKELLESIVLDDLVGDAYDLAFLSNEFHLGQELNEKSQILQIMDSCLEPDKRLSYVQVEGGFMRWPGWSQLNLSQIIKLLIKFAKVIPIAGIASMRQVDFIFNSWVEANTACHFINNLRYDEVCYWQSLPRAGEMEKPANEWFTTSEYYIINDQRKVLEKIIQNKNEFNEINETSTMVSPAQDDKSLFNIYASDRVIMKNLQYLLVISPETGSKFTPSMISIIKMNLVQMDCPTCIEFEDKIWVGVDNLKKGNKLKVRIGKLKFKLVHEKDKHDITIGVEVEERMSSMDGVPLSVALMISERISREKQVNDEKPSAVNGYIHSYVPLGHFNYCYREAAGMTIEEYCHLNSTFKSNLSNSE